MFYRIEISQLSFTNIMRKILLYILLIPLCLYAQDVPNWVEGGERNSMYPRDKYIVGYTFGEQRDGESAEAAIQRVKTDARAEAISSIRVSVNQKVQHQVQSIVTSTDIDEHDSYFSQITTETAIKDIPGLILDVWSAPNGKEVHAIAHVSISDLEKKLQKRIISNLTRTEMMLDNAQSMFDAGQKASAKSVLASTVSNFGDIEADQKLLMAVSDDLDVEDLSIREAMMLYHKYVLMMESLNNGLLILIDGKTDIFGKGNPEFVKKIMGQLSSGEISFTDDASIADWKVQLNGTSRESSTLTLSSGNVYITYVDIDIDITKRANNRLVYSGRLTQKGTDTRSKQSAAADAYHQLENQVVAIIKSNIE